MSRGRGSCRDMIKIRDMGKVRCNVRDLGVEVGVRVESKSSCRNLVRSRVRLRRVVERIEVGVDLVVVVAIL